MPTLLFLLGFLFPPLWLFLLVPAGGSSSGGGQAIVLRRCEISTGSVEEETPFVVIEGRKPGLLAWFLTQMGIDATSSLRVKPSAVEFRQGSLRGEEALTIPARAISAVEMGALKSVEYLVVAALIFFVCMGGAGWASLQRGIDESVKTALVIAGLVLPAVLAVAYFMDRKIVVGLETAGGTRRSISFRSSGLGQTQMDQLADVPSIIHRIANEAGRQLG